MATAEMILTRRGLIGAAGTLLAAPAMSTQTALGPIIDVHHHVMVPSYMKRRGADLSKSSMSPAGPLAWQPQWTLDELDRNGDARAVLSHISPLWFGDPVEARMLAREANDYTADLARQHPTRFAFLACLPWFDVEGSLAEIDYAFTNLKADGVALVTSYEGSYPGEGRFLPIWQELNRRKAVVYFHPATAACCGATVKGLPPPAIEFPFDTTRAIASLLVNMVFTRMPDIRWLFSHGGGALPMLADRLSSIAGAAAGEGGLNEMRGGPMGELKRLHFDTASVANPAAWAALSTLVPTTNILFGTDYPYYPLSEARRALRSMGLSDPALSQVEHLNAERLFPRLARG